MVQQQRRGWQDSLPLSRHFWQSTPSSREEHLLAAVWHVLCERASYKNTISEMMAFKLMVWYWKLSDQERGGLTSRQFMSYRLMRLKLGEDLPYLVTGKNTKRPMASAT